MRNFGVGLLWSIGIPLVLLIVGIASLPSSLIIAPILMLYAIICIFKPISFPGRLKKWGLPGRGWAIVASITLLVVTSGLITHDNELQYQELEVLREADYPAYMRKIKTFDRSKWLDELKASAPEEYLVAIKKIDEEIWFRDVKTLDPSAYAKELDRRKRVIKDLEEEAHQLPAADLNGNIQAYKKLAKLSPDNKRYRDKITVYENLQWQEKKCTNAYKNDAYFAAQDYVKIRLKAPRSAKFPLMEFSSRVGSDCIYYVSSYVDAQNGFGAQIRTYWQVEIIKKPKDVWKLKTINIVQ